MGGNRRSRDPGIADAIEAESAHRLTKVTPAAKVPVGIHRFDAQRVDPSALMFAAGIDIVEFQLKAGCNGLPDEGESAV